MALQEELEKQGIWLFRYRGVIPLIVVAAGAWLLVRNEIRPDTFIVKGTPYAIFYELLCLLISLTGLGIRIFTTAYAPKNTSGRNTKKQVAERLNTTGIYSIVRHPLYLGNYFMWMGPVLLTGNAWFAGIVTLFYWIYYERIMFAEEQFLRRKFGEEYTVWANNVPAFIPKFKNYKKPDLPFSWKKLLRKEKNGLVATLLIFSAYDISDELIGGGNGYNVILIGACILSFLMYAVIKVLIKRTQVLKATVR